MQCRVIGPVAEPDAHAPPVSRFSASTTSATGKRRPDGWLGRMKSLLRFTFPALPYCAAIFSCLPLLIWGFPNGHDWSLELVRLAEFRDALAEGQWPPYWAGNLYGGYGSPIFLFYAPVYNLVSSLFGMLVQSLVSGGTAALVFFSLICAFATQGMMRSAIGSEHPVSQSATRLAVYVYILNPYVMADKLIRNADAEFAALCVVPFALWGLLAIGREPRWRGLLLLSAGFALTILSHNLTALVVAALLALAVPLLYLPSSSIRVWVSVFGGLTLGLVLSAFFWVPALSLKPLVQTGQLLVGKLDFHTQFQPFSTFFSYDQFFSVGLVTPFCLLAAAVVLWRRRGYAFTGRRLLTMALITAVITLFMQFPSSTWIWDHAPFLPLFQFPWRMMGPLALAAAIAASLSFAALMENRTHRAVLVAEVALLLLCAFNALPNLTAYEPLDRPTQEALHQGLGGPAIRESHHSTTVGDDYLPVAAVKRVSRLLPATEGPVVQVDPGARIKTIRDGGTSVEIQTNAPTQTRLVIARWYFPGWQAEIDTKPLDVTASGFGAIELKVPAGQHDVSIRMVPPNVRRICLWISLAGLVFWTSLALFELRRRS